MAQSKIDFDGLNDRLLGQYPDILFQWFPAGSIIGREFCIGNLSGAPGDSCKVNVRTGKWADFASDEKGGDPIGLYAAAFHRGDRVAAARALGGETQIERMAAVAPPPKRKPEPEFIAIVPPPANAPEPDLTAPVGGQKPSIVHVYRDRDGAPLFYIRRIDPPGKRKSFAPLTFGTMDGVTGWHAKHPPAPRPLYNLPALSSSRVRIICEGEKATDAASRLLPDNPCLCWPAGAQNFAHADFTPLAGSKVLLWPDADEPGRKAMQDVAAILVGMGCTVSIVSTEDLPEKFDAADFPPDTDAMAWLKDRQRPFIPAAVAEPAPEPEPANDDAPPPDTDPLANARPDLIPPSYAESELLPSYRELEDRVTGMSETTQPRVIEEFALDMARAKLGPVETERLIRLLKERTKTNVTTLRGIIGGVQKSEARAKAIAVRRDLPLSKRYIYVKQVNMLWDRHIGALVALEAVRNHHWSEMPLDADGIRISPLIPLLQDEDGCEKVEAITFFPGQPEVVEEDGARKLNVWAPPPIGQKEGNVGPFLDHVAYILDLNDAATDHVLDYMAHLIQRPADKIRSTVLIISRTHGNGKSMLAEMLGEIIGRRSSGPITNDELKSQFNEWLDGMQFIWVNELMSMGRLDTMNKLKEYITSDMTRVNRKGVSAYSYRSRVNFMLFSNHEDAASIEEGDRRYFVWVSKAEQRSAEYFADMWRWFRNGGAEALHHYLAHRPLNNFDRHAPAPMTDAKQRIIRASVPDWRSYLQEAFEDCSKPLQYDLVNLTDLAHWMGKEARYPIAASKLARFLQDIGGEQIENVLIGGKRRRVWAIRDVATWLERGPSAASNAFRPIEHRESTQG